MNDLIPALHRCHRVTSGAVPSVPAVANRDAGAAPTTVVHPDVAEPSTNPLRSPPLIPDPAGGGGAICGRVRCRPSLLASIAGSRADSPDPPHGNCQLQRPP